MEQTRLYPYWASFFRWHRPDPRRPQSMGLLAGGLTTGLVLATMLNNADGAWDNAKKTSKKACTAARVPRPIRHKAGVVGDTSGDPCKDTSGPSVNILIKLMTMVGVVFTPVVVKFSPVIHELLNITTK